MNSKDTDKNTDSRPTDFNGLLDALLKQKDELLDAKFLTKNDNAFIDTLPEECKKSTHDVILKKNIIIEALEINLKRATEDLEARQKEKDELFAKLQRVSADYINFQKRVPKQVADTIAYEKEKLIKSLLPTLDNFELTLQNAETAGNIDDLAKGVKIIYDHLLDILKSHNVEQIQAVGEKFDPSQHEAMTHRAEADKEDGVVLEEYQKGYKLNGRVFRPSRVIVNKLPSQQAEPAEEEDETKDTE